MKTLFIATLMCVAAMSAKAQVLTSETVNNVYETAVNKLDGKFYFNAERTGNDITTMYVYEGIRGAKGMVSLKPHMKYEYSYAADGTLTSRIVYRWTDVLNDWKCAARYDYSLANGNYSVEYSRYNPIANRFDQSTEKMVYFLMPYDSANCVSYYQRNLLNSQFHLVSETILSDSSQLFAEK